MTPDEIKAMITFGLEGAKSAEDLHEMKIKLMAIAVLMIGEIAIQLAEINTNFRKVEPQYIN